jgi:LPS-assembly protein
VDWRADYDPLRGGYTNSGVNADYRRPKWWVSLGHNQVRNDPAVGANTNQFRGVFGVGNENRRGWMAGFSGYYDYTLKLLRYATTQVTYNTDCCGFSVQYRRFQVPGRDENQFRVAFVIANIGSFGTLKRQERMF